MDHALPRSTPFTPFVLQLNQADVTEEFRNRQGLPDASTARAAVKRRAIALLTNEFGPDVESDPLLDSFLAIEIRASDICPDTEVLLDWLSRMGLPPHISSSRWLAIRVYVCLLWLHDFPHEDDIRGAQELIDCFSRSG